MTQIGVGDIEFWCPERTSSAKVIGTDPANFWLEERADAADPTGHGPGDAIGTVQSNTTRTFADSFDRANENLEASASWTALSGGIAGGVAVVSNALSVVDTASAGSAYTCPDIGQANHYVQAAFPSLTISSFLCLRLQDQNNWLGLRFNNTGYVIEIYKRVAGTLTLIAQTIYKITAGDVLKYEQYGTYCVVKINGKVRIGPLDLGSLFPAVTKAGLIGRSTAQAAWDSFEAGKVRSIASSGKLDIAVCGDSLSAGQQTGVSDVQSTNAWPYLLQTATGRYVYNGGVPGQTSTQIATRMDGASVATYRSRIWVIWAGRNNYSATATIEADIAAMVATCTSGKYIVMSVLNDLTTDGGTGGTQYGQIVTALNAYLASTYPSNYLDIRSALVALGAPGQPYADGTMYPTDRLPSGLVADGVVHLNSAGYAVVAAQVQAFIAAKGW